jgi:hypothetical protein
MQQATTRREFLAITAAGLASTASRAWGFTPVAPFATVTPDPLRRAREILRRTILEHAKAKHNPLLLLHGVRAMGPDFSVGDIPAVQYLCSHYLQEKSVNGKAYLYMPVEHEGHTNAFLSEAILDVGIRPSYRFRWNGRRYTVADLISSAKARFVFDPGSIDRNDLAWSLLAFAHTTSPRRDSWTNALGTSIRFSEVVEYGLGILEKESLKLEASMLDGSNGDEVANETGGIRNFACAGTHLIYGLATCLRLGHTQHQLPERMKTQFDVLVWRLGADSRLVDQYYQELAGEHPPYLTNMYLWDAKLKFLGHAFEVINSARRFHLFDPTPTQEEAIARAQQELCNVIAAIGREGVGKYRGDKELFDLLVGDACHAYHGLRMVRG